jgi:hypothetical protein
VRHWRLPLRRHPRRDQLARLARSLPDTRDIVDELTTLQVRLNLGGSVHDPNDPVGRLLFNVLAMVAEFEWVQVLWRGLCGRGDGAEGVA